MKRKKKSRKLRNFLIMLLFLIILGSVGWYGYTYILNGGSFKKVPVDVDVNPGSAVEITIPDGADTNQIAEILFNNGLINNKYIFKIISKYKKYDGKYKSGIHAVERGLTYEQYMNLLTQLPKIDKNSKFSIPEGYTTKQIIKDLIKKKNLIGKNLTDEKTFEKLLDIKKYDYKFLKDIPAERLKNRKYVLEGYLFPSTYELLDKSTDEDLVNNMLGEFDKKFKPEYYTKAKDLKRSVDDIITIASLIEREAKKPEERATIASVIYNRLNYTTAETVGLLQIDATIQYIYLNRDGKVKEKLMETDLEIADPYNTYKNKGLPPGPICSPSEASIKAALYPEKTLFFYYVAKGDGSHVFTKTNKEFENAKKKYIK